MKILAIGAHPDDIEVGCSGTWQNMKGGPDIYLLVMTEGTGARRATRNNGSQSMKSSSPGN